MRWAEEPTVLPPAPQKTIVDMPKPSCKSCQFFEGHTCRRRAPVFGYQGFAGWPFVNDDHWCGEFVQKVEVKHEAV